MEPAALPLLNWPDMAAFDGAPLRERERMLAEADRLRRQLEVFLAEGTATVEGAKEHTADGHRTVRAWGQATCNWSPEEALRIARNGRALAALPALREAARRGDVGVAQLSDLGRVFANPRCREAMLAADAALTSIAVGSWYADFAQDVGRWADLADADGAADDHRSAHDRRDARLRIVGKEGVLSGQCDTADAVLLREILERFADAEFFADAEAAAERLGRPARSGDLERSLRQRRFDALKAIFLSAASSSPEVIGTEPLMNIKLDQATSEDLARQLAGEDVEPPAAPTTVDELAERRCESVDGTPLSREAVMAAMLIGRLRGYIADRRGVVVHLGRRHRLFARGARDAVKLQDLRCTQPGCGLVGHRLQVDHAVPWDTGGSTDPENGDMRCGHHNRFATRGYRTVRREDGSWDIYRPDGSRIGEYARPAAA
jgi:hypothetical protein